MKNMIIWIYKLASIITTSAKNIINGEIEQMDRYYRRCAWYKI